MRDSRPFGSNQHLSSSLNEARNDPVTPPSGAHIGQMEVEGQTGVTRSRSPALVQTRTDRPGETLLLTATHTV